MEKDVVLYLKKLEIPFTHGCFVPRLVEIGPVVPKISTMYFPYFVIFFPWKRLWPFILTKLHPFHPRMRCTKFGWNWAIGSREEDFKFCQCIFAFHNYLPLENIWTNLNSLHKQMLCAKIGWNWPNGSGEGNVNLKSLQPDR